MGEIYMNIFADLGVKTYGKQDWVIKKRAFISDRDAELIEKITITTSRLGNLIAVLTFKTKVEAFFSLEEGSNVSLGDSLSRDEFTKCEIIMKENATTRARAQKMLIVI